MTKLVDSLVPKPPAVEPIAAPTKAPEELYLARIKATLEHGEYIDPLLLCAASINKIRARSFGNGGRTSTRGVGDWVHKDDMNPNFRVHENLDPKSFAEGMLKYVGILVSSDKLRFRVEYVVHFLYKVFVSQLGDYHQKIKYMKKFMFEYCSLTDFDWPKLMDANPAMFIEETLLKQPAKRQREVVKKGDMDDKNQRTTKATRTRNASGKAHKCRSRTDPNKDPQGCSFESRPNGCNYSKNGGHECLSCGKDHTAGQCVALGTWKPKKNHD